MLAAYRTTRIPLGRSPAAHSAPINPAAQRTQFHPDPKGATPYAAAHAPKGGVTIQGKRFTGGQFIPAEVMAAATDAERRAVAGGESRDKPLPPEGGVKLKDPAQRRAHAAPAASPPHISPEMPRPAPIAVSPRYESAEAFGASLGAAYEAAGHPADVAARVAGRLPAAALPRLAAHLASVTVHPSPDGVMHAFYDGDPELRSTPPARRQRCLGFYDGATGVLETDGGADPVGTLAHELTHAIDKIGPGAYLSDSDEWRYVWSRELRGGGLSAYAASDPAEGFAEFGRLLWGSETPDAAARFPGVAAFFRKHGLGG